MKGLIVSYPEKGTEIYIYKPQNLNAATYKFTVEKYIPTDYHNKLIDAGLCYYDNNSVEKRIIFELERLNVLKAIKEIGEDIYEDTVTEAYIH